jgi:hypothetical protein
VRVAVFFLAIYVTGCSRGREAASSPEAQGSVITGSASVSLPIWNESDTEAFKFGRRTPNAEVQEIKVSLGYIPPYIDGQTYTDIAAAFGGRNLGVLYTRFANFSNFFVYADDGAPPVGARTITVSDKRLSAEARVVSKDPATGSFELEEFHYDGAGRIIFRCISKMNSAGMKVEEGKIEGKKWQDFYFVWPVSDHSFR